MKRLVLLLCLAAGCNRGGAQKGAPEPVAVHELSPVAGPLVQLLAAESKKAVAGGQHPFAYVSATWCGPCNAIKHNLDKPLMIDAFAGAYIIKLDLDAWQPQLAGAGIDAPQIPAFFALDGEGKPTGRKIDGAAWDADTPETMAPVLKAFLSKS